MSQKVKRIIVVVGVLWLVLIVGALMYGGERNNAENEVTYGTLPTGEYQTTYGIVAPHIDFPAAEGVVQRTEDFYLASTDIETYDIFYHSDSNVVTVMLYKEPLYQTRLIAEARLREVLPYTDGQLCQMPIKVLTNAYVNPAYTGISLGLSFCPGSNTLE